MTKIITEQRIKDAELIKAKEDFAELLALVWSKIMSAIISGRRMMQNPTEEEQKLITEYYNQLTFIEALELDNQINDD